MNDQMKTALPAANATKRTTRDYISIGLRGFCMGSADIVPGVSGGTMAFILGIYEELIDSIRALGRPEFLKAVTRLRIGDAIGLINWRFLLSLGTGIGVAVATLANLLEWLLRHHPVPLWSFFFGLIVASVITVSKRIPKWAPTLCLSLGLGAVLAYSLVGLVPVRTPDAWWFLMAAGALASCALILPGISGAFLLVLLGKYQFVLAAVKNLDVVSVFFIGAGATIGLVSFAQVLGWLFKRHHDTVIALLTGLMIGSLRKVWPWKNELAWLKDDAGELVLHGNGDRIVTEQANFFPDLSSNLPEFATAVALAIAGLGVVMLLDRVANKNT